MSCHNECSSNIYSNSKIYEPTSSHRLNVYPVTPIATLYNYYQSSSENECNTNNVINKGNKIILDVIDLAEDEFFNMFYYTSAKYFCINKANTSSRSIVLACQTYIANDSRVHKLSLYNEVIKSFEQNYNVSANNMNSAALISLQREVYGTQSLASICGSQLGLSWDQVIANLISCDYIEHGCKNSVAIIIFQVNLNYHSCALNVDLTITFQYKVPIFGYILKNVPIPYSNAEEFFLIISIAMQKNFILILTSKTVMMIIKKKTLTLKSMKVKKVLTWRKAKTVVVVKKIKQDVTLLNKMITI
jgi:hypothetical protein